MSVESHYFAPKLFERVLDGLRESGVDIARLTIDDLKPFDELHIRGREATEEQLELAAIESGDRVLDLGCGIGGSARYLAATMGCRIVGVDLAAEFVEAAIGLTARCGLSGLAEFQVGDATSLPFEGESFDVVWTQHVGMNIADKPAWIGEIARLLKPAGRWAGYEVFGDQSRVSFPTPWASVPGQSALIDPAAMRRIVEDAGLVVVGWSDTTAHGLAWAEKLLARLRELGGPPLGPRLLMGDTFGPKFENVRNGLADGALKVFMFVARKPVQ